MKRWITHLTIAAYLFALSFGIVAHAMKFMTSSHPAMYFVVWDMFCGWTAWSTRNHVIAEGESGTYYELTPPPWGAFKPFGAITRQHYDPWHKYCVRLGLNTLKHTDHEPITRIFVVEEAWAKKYNLPPNIWEQRYDAPQERYVYSHVRHVADGQGNPLKQNPNWLNFQSALVLSDNPRLRAEARKTQPFVSFGTKSSELNRPASAILYDNDPRPAIGSPLTH